MYMNLINYAINIYIQKKLQCGIHANRFHVLFIYHYYFTLQDVIYDIKNKQNRIFFIQFKQEHYYCIFFIFFYKKTGCSVMCVAEIT